jgi:hypothetical protein
MMLALRLDLQAVAASTTKEPSAMTMLAFTIKLLSLLAVPLLPSAPGAVGFVLSPGMFILIIPPTTASSSASLTIRISASVVSMFVVLLVIDTSFHAVNVARIRTPTVCGEVAASGSKQACHPLITPWY